MSRSHHHLLAILPLFSILTMSPMELESRRPSRTIASEIQLAHPKYESRAAKIDRTKIEIDKDLDLTCFSERGDALRTRLMSERKEYKVDQVDKDLVAAQKARLNGLVESLVSLEEDMKALKEKQAFEPAGEEIAQNTLNELKTTLESLLIDEIENDLIVLKEEIKKEEQIPVVVKEDVEEPKKSKEEELICELEEQNKTLTKQVQDLLAEQKKIMETMLGMSNMMVQMNQRIQQPQPQRYEIPSWLLSGSLVNPYLQYPYAHNNTIVYYPVNMGQQQQQPQSFIGPQGPQVGAAPQLGQQTLQQASQYLMQNPYQEYDQRYSLPQPILPGSFGNDPFTFNFGAGPFNQLPIQTA